MSYEIPLVPKIDSVFQRFHLQHEKRIAILNPENNGDVYKKFISNLGIFIDKLSTSPLKQYSKLCLENNVVYLGSSIERDGIRYALLTNKDTLRGVVLDGLELGIDLSTGDTDNYDLVTAVVYAGYIRYLGVLGFASIRRSKSNFDVFSDVYSKILSSAIYNSLSDKITDDLLSKIISVLKLHFGVKYFALDKHKAFNLLDSGDKENVKDIFNKFDTNKLVKLYTILSYLISDINVAELTRRISSYFGIFGYIEIMTSFDTLVSYLVSSKYDVLYPSDVVSVVKPNLTSIENILLKYASKTRFDPLF